jgi:hypothetical protein
MEGTGAETVALSRQSGGWRAPAAACLLAALSVAVLVLVGVGSVGEDVAPEALESIKILSGIDGAIAGMRQLWGAAIPAPAAGAAALSTGTGQPHFQNVDLALNYAGQAALVARQVRERVHAAAASATTAGAATAGDSAAVHRGEAALLPARLVGSCRLTSVCE